MGVWMVPFRTSAKFPAARGLHFLGFYIFGCEYIFVDKVRSLRSDTDGAGSKLLSISDTFSLKSSCLSC